MKLRTMYGTYDIKIRVAVKFLILADYTSHNISLTDGQAREIKDRYVKW